MVDHRDLSTLPILNGIARRFARTDADAARLAEPAPDPVQRTFRNPIPWRMMMGAAEGCSGVGKSVLTVRFFLGLIGTLHASLSCMQRIARRGTSFCSPQQASCDPPARNPCETRPLRRASFGKSHAFRGYRSGWRTQSPISHRARASTHGVALAIAWQQIGLPLTQRAEPCKLVLHLRSAEYIFRGCLKQINYARRCLIN